jgi:hypothetical protein
MKFALITESNWGYRFGLNGLLNGLDYHDNKAVDVHFMYTDEVPKEYLEQASSAFDFEVRSYRIADYIERYGVPEGGGGTRWVMEFYKYKLAGELADEYDAVMITDCDYMIGGNIENYFRGVVGNDLIMTSNNMMDSSSHINGADVEAYRTRMAHNDYFFPCMNSPFISDPKRNIPLYDKIFELGHNYGEDIVPFSLGLVAMDRLSDVIVLPGMLWFTPDFGRVLISRGDVNGKRCYFHSTEKMMMMHRHWWCRGEMENEVLTGTAEGTPRREMAWNNVQLMLDECKIINTEWKLPLEWSE